MGAKGGVGCSILTALLSRVMSKGEKIKMGIVDALPSDYSATPAYLSIPRPQHSLDQLLPYLDHLHSKILENYFSTSPEGVAYIPVVRDDETKLLPADLHRLLEGLSPWYDLLFVDLSSFPSDQYSTFFEKSGSIILVSSLDPASLKSIHDWETRLLRLHFRTQDFSLIFNQQNQSQSNTLDFNGLSKPFSPLGQVPFLGVNLSLNLFENCGMNLDIEKGFESLAESLLSKFKNNPAAAPSDPAAAGIENGAEPSPAGDIPLEQINQLHQKLLEELRKSGTLKDQKNGDGVQRETLEPAAKILLDRFIHEMEIPDRGTRQQLLTETLNLVFGLGPLEKLLQDEKITEIMVNGPENIFVEKNGLIERTNARFLNEQQLRTVIERILAPIGRRIDESQPYVDGRLMDGSRVNAVIPPLSLTGPVVTIRKFSKRKLRMEDLIKAHSLTPEAADFLCACVRARKNIVVSGGTGSGKTTLLNILSHYIPSGERIITIEDSAELQLSQDHVISMESRPANLEGKGRVTIRDLVINALRMRPDRIVVGECRGEETLDMLQAMNTGHDGSITTAHANSPRDVLARLETMSLFTGMELPLRAIREQIARAIHIIVQQSRLPGGKRAVTQITEVQGMEGEVVVTQDLFKLEPEKGLVRRPFAPAFIEDLNQTGYQWPGHAGK